MPQGAASLRPRTRPPRPSLCFYPPPSRRTPIAHAARARAPPRAVPATVPGSPAPRWDSPTFPHSHLSPPDSAGAAWPSRARFSVPPPGAAAARPHRGPSSPNQSPQPHPTQPPAPPRSCGHPPAERPPPRTLTPVPCACVRRRHFRVFACRLGPAARPPPRRRPPSRPAPAALAPPSLSPTLPPLTHPSPPFSISTPAPSPASSSPFAPLNIPRGGGSPPHPANPSSSLLALY